MLLNESKPRTNLIKAYVLQKQNKMNDLIRNVLINHKVLDWSYTEFLNIHVFSLSYCKL